MARFAGLVVVLLFLSGCVAGQQIKFGDLAPGSQEAPLGITVLVKVDDNRDFVRSGNKTPAYIGHYRAGLGNPWDVNTYQKKALAEIFREDLERELRSLGFNLGTEQSEKKVQVIIKDWNFDTYMNGKIWYDIEVAVLAKDGQQLAIDKIKETKIIEGSVWVGAKYAFEEEVPKIYADIISRLVRQNSKILTALKN